ncbi:MAG: WG repeat-containing protein [Bacteroidales bacterium]|nr:WG repeat-containing protein [Bacteroidales bacterium]
MKKLLFLTAAILLATANFYADGQTLSPYQGENGKWGYCNFNGIAIPFMYDNAWEFCSGLAKVKLNGKCGFIDETGKEIIPFKYDGALAFYGRWAEVELNGKWGFIDKTGKEVIPLKYDRVREFSEGVCRVQLNDKWGFIDKTGKEIISFKYDEADDFSEGLAPVKLNGKYGFIDKTGKEVIPFKYGCASGFSEGLAAVTLEDFDYKTYRVGNWGVIDKTGVLVIPYKYDAIYGFSEGLAKIWHNGKYGFIDKTGKEVTTFKYDDVRDFSEELAAVYLSNQWGFIDKTGKEVIPLKYNVCGGFSEGLAWVQNSDFCGFIDKTGKEVFHFEYYPRRTAFSEGLAPVQLYREYGYIDKTGKEVIPLKYGYAGYFFDGLALVQLNGKWGYIDKTGKEVIPIKYTENEADEYLFYLFSPFAKEYVEEKINEWQKKDKFETTTEWQQRVNETTRKAEIDKLTKEARTEFLASRSTGTTLKLSFNPNDYDADNETYLIKSGQFGDLLVHVPRKEAPAFESAWEKITKTPQYTIDDDKFALAEIAFTMPDGKTYKYSNQSSLNYTVAQIDYKFDPIEINVAPPTQTTPKGNQTIGTVNVQVGKSDVDMDIPKTDVKNNKTFAIIIANENYRRESKVEFAQNDGETFRKYCIQTLGLPETNVHYTADATLNDIRGEINWLSSVADAYKGEASIIFYYAGHGIPDESARTAYLLPVDGFGTDLRSGYKLDELYETMGKMPAKSVTVFMDACFSGAQRSGDMMASARGVAIKTAPGAPTGNMIVFSAAQGDETAFPYREKGHGMFTYFLLKKLQETKGDVTLGELGNYITTHVGQQSVVVNRKSQTPTVTPASAMADTWEGMRLK